MGRPVRLLLVLALLFTTTAAAPDRRRDRPRELPAPAAAPGGDEAVPDADPIPAERLPEAPPEFGPVTDAVAESTPSVASDETGRSPDSDARVPAGTTAPVAGAAADPPSGGEVTAAADPARLTVTATVVSDGTPAFANWAPGDTTTPSGPLPPVPLSGPCPVFDPGDDCHMRNLVVRTMDTTSIQVDYSIEPQGGPTGPVRLAVRLNSALPQIQLAPGFTVGNLDCPGFLIDADNRGFTCDFGSVSASRTRAIPVLVVAPMSTPHGSLFSLTASLTETGKPSVSDDSEQVMVSAGPRYELVKRGVSVGSSAVPGPTGTAGNGIVERWAIAIRSLTNDWKGLSQVAEPIVLEDFLVTPAGIRQYLRGCSASTSVSDWPSVVSSVGSPSSQLKQSTVTCSQSGGANAPITADVSGIDWSRLTQPPTQPSNAPRGMVTYFVLETWVPLDEVPIGGIDKCNEVETSVRGSASSNGTWAPAVAPNPTVSTWDPVDLSGFVNLLGTPGIEPVANNGACVRLTRPVVQQPAPGAFFFKAPVTPSGHGQAIPPTGTAESRMFFQSTGGLDYPAGAVLCDKWDDGRFFPASSGFLIGSGSGTFNPSVRVEFGRGDWGGPIDLTTDPQKWYRQATSTCDNAAFLVGPTLATPLTGAPLSSIGGLGSPPAGTNMVRITILDSIPAVPANTFADFRLHWQMQPGVPLGQEYRNYSAAYFPHLPAGQQWNRSNCPGGSTANPACSPLTRGQPAGQWSHWWTTIAGSVQVVKTRIDNITFNPGATVTWRVQARGVAPPGGGSGVTSNVVIEDLLPANFSYVPGSSTWALPPGGPPVGGPPSGLLEPSCAPPLPAQQTCSWTIGDLPWTSGFTVDFTFQTLISPFAPAQTYGNFARGRTPDDPAPFGGPGSDGRVGFATALVVQSLGADIDKLVSPAVASPGGTVTYTLRYGNPSSTAVASMDAIDILPYDGDARGSSFGPGTFVLSGVTGSAKPAPAEVIWVSYQDPETLDLIDGARDGYLDTNAAGPAGALPSASFPCLLSQVGAGGCPAIEQVTALRLVGAGTPSQPFLSSGVGPFSVVLTYAVGPCVLGDTFTNSWFARFADLLPIRFQANASGVGGCAPGISVGKDVLDTAGNWVQSAVVPVGSDVSWRITVTNTGGTPLSGFAFTDPAFAGCEATAASAAPPQLDPGTSFSFLCTDLEVGTGYANVITVTATGPDGREVTASDDAVVETEFAPVIDLRPPAVVTPARAAVALTGADIGRLATQAMAAVVAGALLLMAARRRRRALVPPVP